MEYNDHLIVGAALAHTAQAQLLVAVVFMAHDTDRFFDHVRQLGALKRRMGSLLEGRAEASSGYRRTERSRL